MAKKKIPINVLGVKLKNGRESKGLSQEEVAIKLAEFGITVRDIEEWETGYDIPDDKRIRELSNLYSINANELIQLKLDIEAAGIAVNRVYRKKFVGKTFWDIFGDLIVKIIKIVIVALIIFAVIKSGILTKLKNLENENKQEENYIVEDEYLRMLNSKRGNRK